MNRSARRVGVSRFRQCSSWGDRLGTNMRLVAFISAGLAVLAFAGAFLIGDAFVAPLLATGALALTACVCAVVIHSSRRTVERLRKAETLLISNHKRASVWNHHLLVAIKADQLSGANSTGATTAASPRLSALPAGRWKEHPGATGLLASGIFDHEFYAAAANARFDRPLDAAAHFLSIGARDGRMPSPYISAAALPPNVAKALKVGDLAPLFTFLRSKAAFHAPLSELFDARYSGVTHDEARIHAGGVLGAYLAETDGTSTLAVGPESLIAGAKVRVARDAIVEHLIRFAADAVSKAPRETASWDSDAEVTFINQLREASHGRLPFVSIVMPVKDRAMIVPQAIASVQRQTHSDWELIVVDDDSSDDSVAIVENVASKDSRVRVVSSRGTGVSAARNTGLDMATGAYIAFLDSDNQWLDYFLDTAVRAMVRHDLMAAYAAVALHGDDGSVRYRAFEGGIEQLRLLNHIDLNVLILRRDIIDRGVRFDESLKRWVDHDFAIKVAQRADPVLLPFVGCDYEHSSESTDRITMKESEHWQWVALERYWVRWEEAPDPVRDRLSVVMPTYNDSKMTIPAVESVLRDAAADEIDVEVLIVDNGSRSEVGQAILAGVGASPRVRYLRIPRNLNFAIGCNIGAAQATGEKILFLNNDTVVRRGVLRKLLDTLVSPEIIGVQPLLVYGDETVQTAGTVFMTKNSLPSHFLAGHPPADALAMSGVDLDAVTAAAMMMRASDVRMLRGFDSIFVNGMEDVDLCLRARRELPGAFRTVPEAVVTHLESKTPGRGKNVDENRRIFLKRWVGNLPGPQDEVVKRAGFMVSHVGTDGRPVPGPRPVLTRDPADGRCRWGIKIASIPGRLGDEWGDTHFAESLRLSLEAAGAHAVIHRHGAHSTEAAGFDDIALVIRGLDRVKPMPGKVNILWVISHPDKVTLEELREFDLVFAASVPWASRASTVSGREVKPLLQSTDATRFRSAVEPVPLGKPVFVGKVFPARSRPIVDAAVASGADIAVYGPGWEGLLPEGMLRGSYIPNDQLAAYYRGATRVLADHWGTMASEGFIQNRIFDAVAAGARVVSDHIENLEETFEGAVRTYSSLDELAYLLSPESDHLFPEDGEMEIIARRVRSEHSMMQRAQTLIASSRVLLD